MHTDHFRLTETPEVRELNRKRAEVSALEIELAQRELDLATLQAELRAFEARYLRVVGTRYAELDQIEAEIAEALAGMKPSDRVAQDTATQARVQAQDSAHATKYALESSSRMTFQPSEVLKKLFREAAKLMHPDLALDETDREHRHRMMIEVNSAYEAGDEGRLQELLGEWHRSPEAVKGEGVAAELIRIIRKIEQVHRRLDKIKAEVQLLKHSDIHDLWTRFRTSEQAGHDLLAEMAAQADDGITRARGRLETLISRG